MTITQYQAGSTGVAVGVMPATKAKRPKRKVDKKANRRQRLERTLDESLKETFTASDAVALTEPASPRPDNNRE
jgi:hypothetical protein